MGSQGSIPGTVHPQHPVGARAVSWHSREHFSGWHVLLSIDIPYDQGHSSSGTILGCLMLGTPLPLSTGCPGPRECAAEISVRPSIWLQQDEGG